MNCVLVGLFLVHYIQRSFVFPFLIRGGKPTPAVLVLMAFVFCLGNGYMQVPGCSRQCPHRQRTLTH